MEGIRVPARCFSSTVEYRRDHLNNEGVVFDLEMILKIGSKVRKRTMDEWCYENWVHSSHELWKEKNEEEQRREIDMRWKYLKDLLHRQGIETSNHILLLSVKVIEYPPVNKNSSQGIVEFSIGSPDRGLISKKITLIETNKQAGNCIAFGFNPQSGEHEVICISSIVKVFTVRKNTWRRIDAIPPIAIRYDQAPFYVDGCIYWRFDTVTEKFRVIPIPDFIVDSERHKFTQTVELTGIDGCIAVLDWIHADGNIEWTEEIIDMPPHWNGKPDLSIEALTVTGTHLSLLHYEYSDSIFYYNRNTRESIRFPIWLDRSEYDWERII
ncbi:hypothetical protein MKX01_013621 [Papaver californicum]|nr:hypothetical protein MKX01_013621 [Papaver californicum]